MVNNFDFAMLYLNRTQKRDGQKAAFSHSLIKVILESLRAKEA